MIKHKICIVRTLKVCIIFLNGKKPLSTKKKWPMLLESYPTCTCSAIKLRDLTLWIDSLMENWDKFKFASLCPSTSHLFMNIFHWLYSFILISYSLNPCNTRGHLVVCSQRRLVSALTLTQLSLYFFAVKAEVASAMCLERKTIPEAAIGLLGLCTLESLFWHWDNNISHVNTENRNNRI